MQDLNFLDRHPLEFLAEKAEAIRALGSNGDPVEVGQHLREGLARVGRANFQEWLEAAFPDWPQVAAQRFMDAFDEANRAAPADVPPAAPSTSEVARAQVNFEAQERQAGALVRYEMACRAVAEAKSVDEVKDIADKASAMKLYARQAKNKQLEVDAAEIRLRAERRLGEMMAAQRDAGLMAAGARGNPGGQGAPIVRDASEPAQVTLAEAGIDKSLANRARKLASVPEEKFEAHMAEWRERVSQEGERVSMALIAEGRKAERRATRRVRGGVAGRIEGEMVNAADAREVSQTDESRRPRPAAVLVDALKDAHALGLLEIDPAEAFYSLPDAYRSDMRRIGPPLVEWLQAFIAAAAVHS